MKKGNKIYKKVKLAVPHCGDCGEMLSGNGSSVTPYECICGVWEYEYSESCYMIKPREEV